MGGAETQVRYIVDAMQKSGAFDIHVICRWGTQTQPGVQVHTLGDYPWFPGRAPFFFNRSEVQNILERIQPDILYVRVATGLLSLAVTQAARLDAKTVWHIAHEQDLEQLPIRWRPDHMLNSYDRRLFERAIPGVDSIVAQAQYQCDKLQQNYQRKCDRIVPNFHPVPKMVPEKGEELNVLWVANNKPWKQPELFIDLAERCESFTGVRFTMVGRGTHMLKPASPNLTILGELPPDRVNDLLGAAHVFVNTSLYEGFPNTYIQAWMREVPVLSTHVNPDNILDTRSLGRCDPDLDTLARQILYYRDHRDNLSEQGRRVREYALENHTPRNAEQLLDLFRELALDRGSNQ